MSWRDRIVGWWRGMSVRARVHLILLLIVVGGAIGHQVTLWFWFIEDAAITFAYAKHLAMGEGLVPFPGGERVEGYSNPLWVLLLAGVELVGLDVFEAVRWIQVGFTAITVPVVYVATREVTGRDSDVPLLAAAFLAANSQFAVWGSAGLENGLMNMLIALAIWRMWVELRTGSWPISALLWLGVALCRPEGILYAAVAGFLSMVFHLVERRSLMPTAKWLVTFFVPWTGYQAARYSYFAWPFPNTYYAKEKDPEMIRWTTRSWKWSRRFAEELGHAYFIPVYLLGIVGHRGWRLMGAAVAFLVIGATLELSDEQRWLLPVVLGFTFVAFWTGLKSSEQEPPRWLVVTGFLTAVGLVGVAELLRTRGMVPNTVPTPELMKTAPQWVLGAAALVLPLIGIGARGWQARMTCWLLCMATAFFAIYVQGDWMKGFRWYSVATVPGSILLAIGSNSVALLCNDMLGRARERWTWTGSLVAVALLAGFLPLHVMSTQAIVDAPDARPQGILKRVNFVRSVRSRLHHDGVWRDLDVDMGAHLYWSDFEMYDIAGLVDMPLGHHKFERAFMREYLFQEVKPEFAHVHGGWASNSRIPTHPEWRREYFEIPGYPAGKSQFHIGNHIRRDLVLVKRWPHGNERKVSFQGDVHLEGFLVPSEPATGRRMYLEVGVRLSKIRKGEAGGVRLLMALADRTGLQTTIDVPLGYDWVPPDVWKADEVFHGRFSPLMPPDLPPGEYTVAFVFVDADGSLLGVDTEAALPAGSRVADGEDVQPLLAIGEIQFPHAITVQTLDERSEAAVEDRKASIDSAKALRCDEAEHRWWLSRMHRPKDKEWLDVHGPPLNRHLSLCWALWSDLAETREARIEALERARELDHWTPAYRKRASALADELHAEGLQAQVDEDWERAYRMFSDAVRIDRTRSWSRRYAEDARARRLGFDPETKADKEAERERIRLESEARREKAKAERDAKAKAKAEEEPEEPEAEPVRGADP